MPELRFYKHQQLIDELNHFFMSIKINSNEFVGKNGRKDYFPELKHRYPMYTLAEMDNFMFRIMEALKEQSEPMRKY